MLEIIRQSLRLGVISGPFILVGILTRFEKGESTFSERAWLTIWLPFNFLLMLLGTYSVISHKGVIVNYVVDRAPECYGKTFESFKLAFSVLAISFTLAGPAIWVFGLRGSRLWSIKFANQVVTITQQLPGSIFNPNESVSKVLEFSSYMNLSGCYGVRSAMNNRILDQSQSVFARNITRPFILVVVSLPNVVVDI